MYNFFLFKKFILLNILIKNKLNKLKENQTFKIEEKSLNLLGYWLILFSNLDVNLLTIFASFCIIYFFFKLALI